ncbi:hypothetical protein OIU85_017394 [Salix viminalis]|uniref:Leucine-rich repeat-containing N-terminal plant-type domain-containing protein n=1 Tax=Salix viminalis TaxID=40686 RepID=A0A9Q0V7U4_SALVM|nr:hypothetical protein OIU85_017394 [Salix viminalis]
MLSKHNSLSVIIFIFFFFSSSLSSPDFNTLLSFKSSLLDSSNALSTWVNSTNPCTDSWLGVTCNPATHRVTKLVLENLNLTGSIDALSQLTQLRLLSLKRNHLSSAFRFELFLFEKPQASLPLSQPPYREFPRWNPLSLASPETRHFV